MRENAVSMTRCSRSEGPFRVMPLAVVKRCSIGYLNLVTVPVDEGIEVQGMQKVF